MAIKHIQALTVITASQSGIIEKQKKKRQAPQNAKMTCRDFKKTCNRAYKPGSVRLRAAVIYLDLPLPTGSSHPREWIGQTALPHTVLLRIGFTDADVSPHSR